MVGERWEDPRARGKIDIPSSDLVICYFLDPVLELTVPFVEGAAATVFGFTAFGFLASRFPRCSPFAISAPPSLAPECNTCRLLGERRGLQRILIPLEPKAGCLSPSHEAAHDT
jgi:hypothetical protein